MEKRTLLKKYEIPISHLDFNYIKKCTDTKELERIVVILRSGEEGYYPDLTTCAEDKLRELKPQSKVFRAEERILTKKCLTPQEWKEHNAPIIEWSTEIKSKDNILSSIKDNTENFVETDIPPIRKGGKVTAKQEKTSNLAATSVGCSSTNRVATTNYSDWDKYDADAELLKIDLEQERAIEHVQRMNRVNQEKSAPIKIIEEIKPSIYDHLSEVEKQKLWEDCKILGNECFKSGEYTDALYQYSRGIQILPTVAGYNNRAVTNLKLQKYTDALSDCEECLRREPKNIKALLRKAEAFLGLGRKLEAHQTYDHIKVIEPTNSIACKAFQNLQNELGDVAPSHATRIKIVQDEKMTVESKPKPKISEKPNEDPPVDYDLAELIKPTNVVKSKLAKTMENFGKLTPNPGNKANTSSEPKKPLFPETKREINLFIEKSKNKVEAGSSLLIQEL